MYRQADEDLPLTLGKPAEVLVGKGFDNSIRWQSGERLDHLFEQCCDQLQASGQGSQLAVDADDVKLTYADLDRRANQTARYLIEQGIRSGDRVGLLFKKSIHTYSALLAVLKVNAAYVPFDASFPPDRIAFMLDDAEIKAIVTVSEFQHHVGDLSVPVLCLDADEVAITAEKDSRLGFLEKGASSDQLCYIIYTSGSTGKPKGVAVNHPSICNFVRVAGEVYGIQVHDRMYQGLTIAFDFSVEEIWVPWMMGATLVPGKADGNLVGQDLADFLIERQVTALCCVPTLLATIDQPLPDLRFLLVSGEACPHDLVVRWHHPERIFLNAYGPTEATVTATLTSVHPDKAVTIGGPLPTYSIIILDENENKVMAQGQSGEICIAGIGLAEGYVNRPDLTEKVFIDDFLDLPYNPSRRIYRTGDLGCINAQDQIVYQGRIDTQVKIRGYRIELSEIESVLMGMPEIAQAVVNTYESEPGAVELVAYYSLVSGVSEVSLTEVSKTLREHLPAYMKPAYFEYLPVIPMTSSHKADRKSLPAPSAGRFIAETDYIAPRSEMEVMLSEEMAVLMKLDQVSIEDDFFKDLGAHSLLMAQLCTQLRTRLGDADVSMRDIYLHPTIAGLADFLETQSQTRKPRTIPEPYRIPTHLQYYGCGALQLLWYSGSFLFGFWVMAQGMVWVFTGTLPLDLTFTRSDWFDLTLPGTTWLDLYMRIFGLLIAALAFSITLPIAMKWLLIGRWKPEKIPVWSLGYFRFWVVKWLISTNPMMMFKGLPLFNVYLRLLGAKIGKHVVYEAQQIPVCTDLLSIGDHTLIRKEVFMLGYKAQSGYIHTGSISMGNNAYVGVAAVVDIDTVMEDNTQLGHASSLPQNQTIPAGKHYHGSPAEETTTDYCKVEPKKCSTLRRTIYTAIPLFGLLVSGPVLAASMLYSFRYWLKVGTYAHLFPIVNNFVLSFQPWQLVVLSLFLFLLSIVMSLLFIAVVPKLLNCLLKENRVYVLFGVHYWIVNLIRGLSNVKFLNLLFGDSSAVVHYLKFIGYDLSSKLVQTGSNFGVEQKHDNPHLCSFGSGTTVADGLSMINIQMSSTSFTVNRATLGARTYVGNDIHYPSDSKAGNNCLLATKVMIPIEGGMREGVGLLGSPCFEIPRMVDRDRDLSSLFNESLRQQRLFKKNIHNFITALSYLFWLWLFSAMTLLISYSALYWFASVGLLSFMAAAAVLPFIYIGYFVIVERINLALVNLKPQIVSIYDTEFWRVERYWKHSDDILKTLYAGTPFKNIITRLLGVKLGKKTFDDGLAMSENSLVEIGDYCTFNVSSGLQSHSLEEGVFKCDRIKVGNGCTVGTNVLVHYGTTVEDNVIIGQDSFLMKGEVAQANSIWRGNPARQV